MSDPYHTRLATEAEAHWVRHLAAGKDSGVEAEHATTVLLMASAMAEAHLIGWGETGEIEEARLDEIVADFELCFLKTLLELTPDRLSAAFWPRMAALDRDVKRRRGLPLGGGEA
jgi:hypothetical protein